MFLFGAFLSINGADPTLSWLTLGLGVAVPSAYVVIRFGLLMYVVAAYVRNVLLAYPFSMDFDVWFAGAGLGVLLIVAGQAALGFRLALALAGQPVIRLPGESRRRP